MKKLLPLLLLLLLIPAIHLFIQITREPYDLFGRVDVGDEKTRSF